MANTDPTAYDLDSPSELEVEQSIDSAVSQLDIIGGKVKREVMLVGSDFDGPLPHFVISTNQGTWNGSILASGLLGVSSWSNFNQENYYNPFNAIISFNYRYNLKKDIFETLLIGKNLQDGDAPYRMFGNLLLGRDKTGQFMNPDDPTAYEAVSAEEILRAQYPMGGGVEYDRGYIYAEGMTPISTAGQLIMSPQHSIEPPQKLTMVFECAYRAWVSQTTNVSGSPSLMRRAIVRNEFVHKVRGGSNTNTTGGTKYLMPVTSLFYPAGTVETYPGTPTIPITYPTGATPDFVEYPSTTAPPLDPLSLTFHVPSGIVVDGVGALEEVKDQVAPYVGLKHVTVAFGPPLPETKSAISAPSQ